MDSSPAHVEAPKGPEKVAMEAPTEPEKGTKEAPTRPEKGTKEAPTKPEKCSTKPEEHSASKNPFVALVSAVEGTLQTIFSFAVDFTALFMSAVMNHPQVIDAGSRLMVAGMNRFMEQEDLGRRILEADERMTDANEAIARKAGSDLPKMAAHFWKGFTGEGQEDGKK